MNRIDTDIEYRIMVGSLLAAMDDHYRRADKAAAEGRLAEAALQLELAECKRVQAREAMQS